MSFEQTKLNQIKRGAKLATYDKKSIYAIFRRNRNLSYSI